jgi:hypothetical protein
MQEKHIAPLTASRAEQQEPKEQRTGQRAVSAGSGAPHRVNHGSSAWSLPSRRPSDLQPQDGSLTNPARIAELPARGSGVKIAGESEDSRITGGTRSLMRRVLGLNNVTAEARKMAPARNSVPARVA